MGATFRPVLGVALAVALAGCSHGISAVAPSNVSAGAAPLHQSSGMPNFEGAIRPDGTANVCATPADGYAACNAVVRLVGGVGPDAGAYGPSDLISAYHIIKQYRRPGQVVAIVDAYDDPKAESDLGVYRSHFGLPACTTSNGCFRKVNQAGKPSPLPITNTGWALEESLDVDMVSAICPSCKILLVEGNNNTFESLGHSENTAARLKADEINNSYGGGEKYGYPFNNDYNHPGVMITASAGDFGYGKQFPADSQYVTAVGGTDLLRSTNKRGWTETVWSGTGSGCSKYAPKPSWQVDPSCPMRMIADVAAVASGLPGVVVYDSFNEPGFISVGGTSVASPIIASVYALAGNGSTIQYGSRPYSRLDQLWDVTSGSNGTCHIAYFCNGEVGYDGPTGNGTPNGVFGF